MTSIGGPARFDPVSISDGDPYGFETLIYEKLPMKRVLRPFVALLTLVALGAFLPTVFLRPANAADDGTPVRTEDFSTYCKAHGYADAKLFAQNAYGWRCVRNASDNKGVAISVTAVCREVTMQDNSDAILDFLNDYRNTGFYGWECYRLSRTKPLGRLDVKTYCESDGDKAVLLDGKTALSWECQSPNQSVRLYLVDRLTIACARQYSDYSDLGTIRARVVDFNDPDAIDCMV